jgi:hypothetical protein
VEGVLLVGQRVLGATKYPLAFGRHGRDREIVERHCREPGKVREVALPPIERVPYFDGGLREVTVDFVIVSVFVLVVKTREERVGFLVFL